MAPALQAPVETVNVFIAVCPEILNGKAASVLLVTIALAQVPADAL